MKVCRVCGEQAKWILKEKNNFNRNYCSLLCLILEVNGTINSSYSTPNYENTNSRFYKKNPARMETL